MFRKAMISCILISLPFQVHAGTYELESAIMQSLPFGPIRADLSMRKGIAEAILNYWEEFSSRVPRLSPAEREWLQNETSQKGERGMRAYQSSEDALRRLDIQIEMCLSSIRSVIEAQSSTEPKQTEMLFWVNLINCYDGTFDMLRILQQARLSNGLANDTFSFQYSALIQGDLVNIVIPSAMADVMGWTLSKP